MEIKNIFFDLDHTLWDFEKNSALTFELLFKKYNLDIDLNSFLVVYVPINLEYWRLYRNEAISKEYLRFNLEKTNTQKVESSEITISIQNNPHKVVITNENDIPDKFLEKKEVQTIDKTKIKEALKNGEDVAGCELIQEKRVSIK